MGGGNSQVIASDHFGCSLALRLALRHPVDRWKVQLACAEHREPIHDADLGGDG